MHEVGLMQQALEIAEEHARGRGAACIHRIVLRVGALSGADPDALAFAFEAVSAGTMAGGAELNIEAVSVVCYCAACGVEFQPADGVFACPHCGRLSHEVRRGAELELASLEVS